MNSYTDNLEAGAIDLDDSEAINKLPEIIASFRGHGTALSEFMDANGYPAGQENTPKAKAAFLKQKFEETGISGAKARYALKWLTEPKGFERQNGFRIAFALGLDIEKTDEFFRTVLLDRGFDCHTIEEAVYYYCICHRKGYPTAERLLLKVPEPEKIAVPFAGDVLYTRNIISFIRSCTDEEMLLSYFRDNLAQFGYNQVKAKEYIRSLWTEIAKPSGLAEMERKYLIESDNTDRSESVPSTWDIYLQILGLDSGDVSRIKADRTIKPIIDNKVFMHEFAAQNYPTRQGIEKLLRGEAASHDMTRKTLIMLAFYHFWMNIALSRHGHISYEAGKNDRERCIAELDQYLMDAGFPEMYAGNPYDWIFLWAAGREAPILSFHSYWQLLSAEYSEQVL